MAEGILGGILGEDEEKPDIESPEALASVDAFASAVAAKLAGNDPGVARKTEEFLIEQTELLRVQKEHLKAEHAARLHFLQGQAREVDIRRLGLRLRVGFQLFLLLVASVIGIGGAVLIHDAVTSRGVVMDPFEIPRALAERGLTGTSELPAGYYSWGLALAKHGDLAGAEAKLKEANQRGPHWADPLKAWGDVFEKQGKTKEALAKYDDALKYAPNWKQLKEAREAVAKQKS